MVTKENTSVKNLLPLGSVVTLKGSDLHRLMIIEYYVVKDSKKASIDPNDLTGKVFDYEGIDWYEGRAEPREIILFNHDKIQNVLFRGYINDTSREFMNKLDQHIKEKYNI